MADRRLPSYPPVGEPERLDAIMSRGRSLRRRRQLALGAGAGGGALAVVVAMVLVVGGAGAGTEQIDLAGDDTTTSSSTTAPPTTELPDEMVVTAEPYEGDGTLVVDVVDPDQPDLDDAKQCLTVQVRTEDGTTVATGWGCNAGPGDSTAARLVVVETVPGVEISPCAVTIEPRDPDAVAPGTRPARTSFELALPTLAPGTYDVLISATSGTGDGCAAGEDPEAAEIENVAETTIAVRVTD